MLRIKFNVPREWFSSSPLLFSSYRNICYRKILYSMQNYFSVVLIWSMEILEVLHLQNWVLHTHPPPPRLSQVLHPGPPAYVHTRKGDPQVPFIKDPMCTDARRDAGNCTLHCKLRLSESFLGNTLERCNINIGTSKEDHAKHIVEDCEIPGFVFFGENTAVCSGKQTKSTHSSLKNGHNPSAAGLLLLYTRIYVRPYIFSLYTQVYIFLHLRSWYNVPVE